MQPAGDIWAEAAPALAWDQHAHAYQRLGCDHLVARNVATLFLAPGYGKLQPVTEPVYTPDGWRPIGDLAPGDFVYGFHGRPIKVVATFPQVDRRCLKVTFTDGTFTYAGPDHLWTVARSAYAAAAPMRQKKCGASGRYARTGWETLTTQQIIDEGVTRDRPDGRHGGYWRLPVADAVEHPDADLPIPPYTMGALIGDGALTLRSGVAVSVPEDKECIRRRVMAETPETPWRTVQYGSACRRVVAPNGHLRDALEHLGLLGACSGARFIPEVYLRGSIRQRTDLLHGLMDTDGGAAKNRVTFHTTSEQLCRDVAELVRSLGGIAKVRHYARKDHTKSDEWQVNVKTRFCPFMHPRKAREWTPHRLVKMIHSIESAPDQESVCILVDDPEHLYLTRDFIVTHNTAITLHAFKRLMDAGQAKHMLVVAPLRVAQTVWAQEIERWASLNGLRACLLHGTKKEKWLKRRDVNVWLINYEGLQWLRQMFDKRKVETPFDVIVFDEIRRMKESTGMRFKAVKPIAAMARYRWGLTGTPVSNGLMDLFGQFLILDGGAALGSRITRFRLEFFEKGFDGFTWLPRPGAQDAIEARIRDYVFRADGLLDLPEFVYDNRRIVLDDKARAAYDRMKQVMVSKLEGTTITAANAAVVVGKLKQMSNGRVYDEDRNVVHVHKAKQDALRELVEEMGDEQLLIAYDYHHDLEQIREVLGHDIPYLGAGVTSKQAMENVDRWNAREIQFMAANPACLHPDTLVLTEHRGWVKIVDVQESDLVFDGVEWVRHRGCRSAGVKQVMRCFGITMTPDHRILVGDTWRSASDVCDSDDARQSARVVAARSIARIGGVHDLWRNNDGDIPLGEASQPREAPPLRALCEPTVSQHDRNSPIPDMAWPAREVHGPEEPELETLRRARHPILREMGDLSGVLGGHGRHVSPHSDYRADGCERPLREEELSLGFQYGTASEQAEHSHGNLRRGDDAPGRVLSPRPRDAGCDNTLSEPVFDRRRRDESVCALHLPEAQEIEVFDLVDCGPRSRFMVLSQDGHPYIVHNSAGHGLNLQKGGACHILWWGPTFDLDHYVQFNDRLRRQGNAASTVFVHTFVTERSVDEVAMKARVEKASVQDALLAALTSVTGDNMIIDTPMNPEESVMELQFKSDAQMQQGQPQANPFMQPPAQPNPFAAAPQGQPQANPFAQAAPAQNPFAQPPAQANPFAQATPSPQQMAQQVAQQQAIQQDVAAAPPPSPEQMFAQAGFPAPGTASAPPNPFTPVHQPIEDAVVVQETPAAPQSAPPVAQEPAQATTPAQNPFAAVAPAPAPVGDPAPTNVMPVAADTLTNVVAQSTDAASQVPGMVPLYMLVPAEKMASVMAALGRALK